MCPLRLLHVRPPSVTLASICSCSRASQCPGKGPRRGRRRARIGRPIKRPTTAQTIEWSTTAPTATEYTACTHLRASTQSQHVLVSTRDERALRAEHTITGRWRHTCKRLTRTKEVFSDLSSASGRARHASALLFTVPHACNTAQPFCVFRMFATPAAFESTLPAACVSRADARPACRSIGAVSGASGRTCRAD